MLLVISPYQEDYATVRNAAPSGIYPVSAAHTVREALAVLHRQPARIVITERDLPDGDWRQVLDALPQLPRPPLLIVASRHADDRLWAEVLNLGGYDVLIKPFDQQELTRVLHLASGRPMYDKNWAPQWALTYG
jgi:DNA-binding response OmpR family regulator